MDKSVLSNMTSSSSDMTIDDVLEIIKTSALSGWMQTKSTIFLLWSRTTKRIRIGVAITLLTIFTLLLLTPSHPTSLPPMPSITINYDKNTNQPTSPYNVSKVALLIENRPNPILAPLMLHFMAVVPPDWRFRFMGSPESVAHISTSRAIRDAVEMGKLDLTLIPSNMTTGSQEEISQFLTTLWLYETVLQPAEWLLVFQTDSMLCANSRKTLNNYLEYDWVGAPWNPNGRFGGNGGLSLRRVSSIVDVLRNQVRPKHGEPEDVWLTDRLGHRPGARLANGTASLVFSGEMHSGEHEKITGDENDDLIKGVDDWRDGFYEPMGYHTGGSGSMLHGGIWGKPDLRKHIWDYCPEMKMTLKMDAQKYVPGDCHANWKRGEDGLEERFVGEAGEGMETEWIDGVEYPMLPPGLVPW